jgi:hypothetical protein
MQDARIVAAHRTANDTGQVSLGFLCLLALGLVACTFVLDSRTDFGLSDEGFLWEGVLKTRLGLVPGRDFMAYDPGRYYWCAACMYFTGWDLVSLRLSITLFQLIGLLAGLLASSRVARTRLTLTFVGILLLCWMTPPWKLFEHSLALLAVYGAVLLIEQPSFCRHLGVGVVLGFVAFFGRNHFAYSLLAFVGIVLLIHVRTDTRHLPRSLSGLFIGVTIGLMPIFGMLLCLSGYLESNLDWLKELARFGSTNLPLPVPWPWRVVTAGQPLLQSVSELGTGCAFILLPVLTLLLLTVAFRTPGPALRQNGLLVAGAFVGFFYLHHAFARADASHLAQGAHPCLLATIAWLLAPRHFSCRILGRCGAALLLLLGVAVSSRLHPFLARAIDTAQGLPWVQEEIAGRSYWLRAGQADYVRRVRRFVAQHARPRDGIFIAPFEPGLYPLLGRTAPVTRLYPLFPASAEVQRQMIEELRRHNVRWAIINDAPLDGRDDLRFRHSHPLVWQFLCEQYHPSQAASELPERIVLTNALD